MARIRGEACCCWRDSLDRGKDVLPRARIVNDPRPFSFLDLIGLSDSLCSMIAAEFSDSNRRCGDCYGKCSRDRQVERRSCRQRFLTKIFHLDEHPVERHRVSH